MIRQPDLIRSKVMRLLEGLRIYVSCLPETETVALERLRDPLMYARVVEFVLVELGAEAAGGKEPAYFGKARRVVGAVGLRGEPRKRKYKKRDKEFWRKDKKIAKPEEPIAEGFTKVSVAELNALLAPDTLPPIYKSVTEVTETGESLA